MLYVLYHMGIAERVGKQGKSFLYQIRPFERVDDRPSWLTRRAAHILGFSIIKDYNLPFFHRLKSGVFYTLRILQFVYRFGSRYGSLPVNLCCPQKPIDIGEYQRAEPIPYFFNSLSLRKSSIASL